MDYTSHTGPLYEHYEAPWKMYSFDRPSAMFWNGVANYCRDTLHLSDKAIGEVLMSKQARWLLDQHDQELELLGSKIAAKYFNGKPPRID